ncbi:MAG: sugar transferase [Verrucomicrobiota bacterium]
MSTPRWKRVLDLSLIALAFPLLLPLMLVVAAWIRVTSGGPVLFRQERIGRGGRRFLLFKFRSMKVESDAARHAEHIRSMILAGKPMRKLDEVGDDRLIVGGCLLRSTGLDELPQLLNVIRGEMSLVGPRPCLPLEFEFFRGHPERFKVLPGITGLWQVKGKNALTFDEMIAHDGNYAGDASFLGDLGILLRTPMVILRQMANCFSRRRARVSGENREPVPQGGGE